MTRKQKEEIEQPIGRVLSHTGKSFLHLLNARLHRLDIKRNYYALVLIDKADGSITQQDLAELLETDKVSIVRIIDYLSDKGYVKRIKSVSDRRKYGLMLTGKARKEIKLIKDAIQEVKNIAFKGMNSSQVEVFYATLKILRQNLNAYKKNYE
jgi:MarR family transcriptional regulator, transcriptional regulator for hemolysin